MKVTSVRSLMVAAATACGSLHSACGLVVVGTADECRHGVLFDS